MKMQKRKRLNEKAKRKRLKGKQEFESDKFKNQMKY